MNDIKDMTSDSPIRISVAPQKSSYFAGETMEVHISIHNTRTAMASQIPSSPTPPRSLGHKRASHSISSAQLYRPPTSPGPSAPINSAKSQQNYITSSLIQRKGLVGSKFKPRSFSVDISNIETPSDNASVQGIPKAGCTFLNGFPLNQLRQEECPS
jgi:hypothetical protein